LGEGKASPISGGASPARIVATARSKRSKEDAAAQEVQRLALLLADVPADGNAAAPLA